MEEEEKKNLADCIRNPSSSKLAHRIFFYKDLVILQIILKLKSSEKISKR